MVRLPFLQLSELRRAGQGPVARPLGVVPVMVFSGIQSGFTQRPSQSKAFW